MYLLQFTYLHLAPNENRLKVAVKMCLKFKVD